MSELIEKIKQHPVRFEKFLQALFGLFVMTGLLTEPIIGGILLVINTFLAFWLEGFTTPVDRRTGAPLGSGYKLR